jgi:hypothetical protein
MQIKSVNKREIGEDTERKERGSEGGDVRISVRSHGSSILNAIEDSKRTLSVSLVLYHLYKPVRLGYGTRDSQRPMMITASA